MKEQRQRNIEIVKSVANGGMLTHAAKRNNISAHRAKQIFINVTKKLSGIDNIKLKDVKREKDLWLDKIK